jgi:hypothetical protein
MIAIKPANWAEGASYACCARNHPPADRHVNRRLRHTWHSSANAGADYHFRFADTSVGTNSY